MRTALLLVALSALSAFGCATKRLPPGTPPPEYETRELPPWSAETPDAGPSEQAAEPTPAVPETPPSEQPKTDPAPLDAGASPSPDAGVR